MLTRREVQALVAFDREVCESVGCTMDDLRALVREVRDWCVTPAATTPSGDRVGRWSKARVAQCASEGAVWLHRAFAEVFESAPPVEFVPWLSAGEQWASRAMAAVAFESASEGGRRPLDALLLAVRALRRLAFDMEREVRRVA